MSRGVALQEFLHSLTQGSLFRFIRWAFSIAAAVTLLLAYQSFQFRGLGTEEAMESAHLARQLADGNGFTTLYIRPFNIWLLERHTGRQREFALRQPEIGCAPLYPYLLSKIFVWTRVNYDFPAGRTFFHYGPEVRMCLFSECLLLLSVLLFYLAVRRVGERRVAMVSAAILLLCNHLWRHAMEGDSFNLVFFLFICMLYALVRFHESESQGSSSVWIVLAAIATGLGFLTQYRFGILIFPLVGDVLFFQARRRWLHLFLVILVFAAIASPWIARNMKVSGLPFGSATYAAHQNTDVFPGTTLEQQVQPKFLDFTYKQPRRKWMANTRDFFENELPKLGGNFLVYFFVSGLFFRFKSPALKKLRHFGLLTFGWMIVLLPFIWNPGNGLYQGEFYSLMIPLIFFFGTIFFFILLDRFQITSHGLKLVIATFFILVNSISMIFALFPPRPHLYRYPPYYPPMIHSVSTWMEPKELMMSDMPCAVCWYGNIPCVPLTKDVPGFLEINDYVKKVSAVLMTPLTYHKGLSELFQNPNGWGYVIFGQFPKTFPLRIVGPSMVPEVFFITDHMRWQSSGG